ncbi:MAG: UDP-N-acetylglucosamine 1-carboxyvinyltransferase [Candidatus Tritonobacter lacicola]|nr:UDP-N-acetylglucosamine 1-carboxyvinyltransferase [Candidatus Tritonobacter lacicola]
MEKMIIEGGACLRGTVEISGAKNACLPIMAASIMAEGPCVIRNAPRVSDVNTLTEMLRFIGATVDFSDNGCSVRIDPSGVTGGDAPYEMVKKMRASICFLGPLLARFGRASISLPGGCVIGPRPIGLHLKGLAALGARIELNHGYIEAEADGLRGAEVFLAGRFGPSVLATANVMSAAVLAGGTTRIIGAACEPEIVDLAEFLISMGARIRGHGSHILEIDGVEGLSASEYTIIPDRIEAGTFMAAAAITGGEVVLAGARHDHLGAVVDKLAEAGVEIRRDGESVVVKGTGSVRNVDVATHHYPGFPTDLQAQLTALMTVSEGISIITEKVFPERFMHVPELNRMAANISIEGPSAIVRGVRELSGAPVMASDLRASAALIIAGLVAGGRTEVNRVYHIDRGYDGIEKKLSALGARIWREKGSL